MVDIPTISAIVAAASVVVGVIFTFLEIRHLARTRRTDIVMRIYERWGNREILEALGRVGAAKFETFDDYRQKYSMLDVEQLAVFFEGIGALLEQDLIEIKLIDTLFGPPMNMLWESTRPVIYGMREVLKQPFLFSHYEFLAKRLSAYRKERRKS